MLLLHADLHDEELLASLHRLNASDALPDLVSIKNTALVQQETRRLRHVEHTDAHDGREDEGASKNVAPVARHGDEHRGDGISKDLTKSNVELVQRHQVSTELTLDGLGDVDGDGTTLKTNTGSKDQTGNDDHCEVHGTGAKGATDCVENAGDEDCPATTEHFVARRDQERTSNGTKRHGRVDQAVLALSKTEISRKEEVGAGDKRLIETRQETTHGSKDDEPDGEKLGVGEFDVEETPLVTRALDLLLKLLDQSIGLPSSVLGNVDCICCVGDMGGAARAYCHLNVVAILQLTAAGALAVFDVFRAAVRL
jgi:hypothetical protein